jgi:hypothetical protein
VADRGPTLDDVSWEIIALFAVAGFGVLAGSISWALVLSVIVAAMITVVLSVFSPTSVNRTPQGRLVCRMDQAYRRLPARSRWSRARGGRERRPVCGQAWHCVEGSIACCAG